jgi:DNA-binding response OmpR family regulator
MSETEQIDENKKTILLVEDSTTQAMRLLALLEQAGLNVLWAQDGQAGLELAQQQLPDLVVLDVQLPKMNGFQVCAQLKKNSTTANIPVIMLTHHDDPEAIMLGLQSGVVDYIPKDAFADAVLVETLRQMGLTPF